MIDIVLPFWGWVGTLLIGTIFVHGEEEVLSLANHEKQSEVEQKPTEPGKHTGWRILRKTQAKSDFRGFGLKYWKYPAGPWTLSSFLSNTLSWLQKEKGKCDYQETCFAFCS